MSDYSRNCPTCLDCKFIRIKETDAFNNVVTKLKEVL